MTRGEGALLVLASAYDEVARGFVERYADAGAVLATPRDLSREGWRMRLGDAGHMTAVANGLSLDAGALRGVLTRLPAVDPGELSHIAAEDRAYVATEMTAFLLAFLTQLPAPVADGLRLDAGALRGVLTRLPAVDPAELAHIAAEDRAYVATEMTAFLLAFLTQLPAPVANRPTPLCLCGQYWRDEKWRCVARDLGLAATPMRRRVALGEAVAPPFPGTVVTIVADSCIGAATPALADAARALARRASADLLAIEFDGPEAGAAVLRASPLVDLGDDQIAAAAFGLFDRAAFRALAEHTK